MIDHVYLYLCPWDDSSPKSTCMELSKSAVMSFSKLFFSCKNILKYFLYFIFYILFLILTKDARMEPKNKRERR
jgi:hypothetical protein